MEFVRPETWREALEVAAAHPEAVPIAGGTDVMVELNFDRHRPQMLLDLTAVEEIADWEADDEWVRIGAALPYGRIIEDLADALPGLAMASRTVGSPQIRNRGTVGGNLATASPAGDTHPVLLATNALVEVESTDQRRVIRVDEFYTGVKRTALRPGELIRTVHAPIAAGPQQFSKIGTRNAMVISVCAFGLALHPQSATAGTGLGSAAPTPRPAARASEFLAGELDAAGLWHSRKPLPDTLITRFGQLVAEAAEPIDDVRGTGDYRRHALAVLARRTLSWAWSEYREGSRACA